MPRKKMDQRHRYVYHHSYGIPFMSSQFYGVVGDIDTHGPTGDYDDPHSHYDTQEIAMKGGFDTDDASTGATAGGAAAGGDASSGGAAS